MLRKIELLTMFIYLKIEEFQNLEKNIIQVLFYGGMVAILLVLCSFLNGVLTTLARISLPESLVKAHSLCKKS